MPNCTFTAAGTIVDFSRVDNAFDTIKKAAASMLKEATLTVTVEYTEKIGTGELPK
jgi:hypothetical protein